MPNHVTNILDVTGPAKSVEAFKNKVFSYKKDGEENKPCFDFNATVPMPAELKGTQALGFSKTRTKKQKSLLKKYGASDWYEWANKFWGTKWGAYDALEPEQVGTDYRFNFNTAWGIGGQWLETTSKMFPDLTFTTYWHDEGGGSGIFVVTNGISREEALSDEDFAERFDPDYREQLTALKESSYPQFKKHYILGLQKGETEIWYGNFYKEIVKRTKDIDLPLLIGIEEFSDEAKHLLETRLKEATPKRKILWNQGQKI